MTPNCQKDISGSKLSKIVEKKKGACGTFEKNWIYPNFISSIRDGVKCVIVFIEISVA